jgi:hypothetical protein
MIFPALSLAIAGSEATAKVARNVATVFMIILERG